MPHSDPNWQRFRDQMPVTQRWAYFDNAAVAPISGPAHSAMQRWSDEAARHGDTVWPEWAVLSEKARELAAELIGASTDEVALVANTTTGIGLVAEGLPWQTGDNLVIPDNEFPSNAYPWLNLGSRGVDVRQIKTDRGELDLDRLFAACDDRTRLIALSWIGYASGWKSDVGEVVRRAHEREIHVFLDAIQGLGVFPLNVAEIPVDFLAADGHKWLLGPEGAGIFYLRREHLARLRPLGVGWNSVVHRHDYTHLELKLRNAAARYEGGSINMPGFIGLGASLDLLKQCGLSAERSDVADRVLEITDLACRRLEEIGATIFSSREVQRRSGIVAFDIPGRKPEDLRKACLAQNVALSCRGGRLRISPHAYADAADVEQLVNALLSAK